MKTRIRTLFPIVDPEMPVSNVWELVDDLKVQGIVLAKDFGFFRLAHLKGMIHPAEPIGTELTPTAHLKTAASPGKVVFPAESTVPIIVGRAKFKGTEMFWTLDPFILRLPPSSWVCSFGHSVSPYPGDGKCPDHGLPLKKTR